MLLAETPLASSEGRKHIWDIAAAAAQLDTPEPARKPQRPRSAPATPAAAQRRADAAAAQLPPAAAESKGAAEADAAAGRLAREAAALAASLQQLRRLLQPSDGTAQQAGHCPLQPAAAVADAFAGQDGSADAEHGPAEEDCIQLAVQAEPSHVCAEAAEEAAEATAPDLAGVTALAAPEAAPDLAGVAALPDLASMPPRLQALAAQAAQQRRLARICEEPNEGAPAAPAAGPAEGMLQPLKPEALTGGHAWPLQTHDLTATHGMWP